MNASQGQEMGRWIVEAHGGERGAELAVAMMARRDGSLAGRLAGSQIVAAWGGRTGADLANRMTRRPCGANTFAP